MVTNFYFLRLITKAYPKPIRYFLSMVGFSLAWAATGQRRLAVSLSKRLSNPDGLFSGLRLLSWYIGRRLPSFPLSQKDRQFDFTGGMKLTELRDVQRFVTRKSRLNDPQTTALDQMLIAARQFEAAIETQEWAAAQLRFTSASNHYLALNPLVQKETIKIVRPVKKPFSKINAAAALADLAALLPVKQWRWFLISGTFLGLIREGGFLAHDYDIDVGFMGDGLDLSALLARIAASTCFVLRKCDLQRPFQGDGTSKQRPTLLKVTHKTGIEIDIFLHYLGRGRDGQKVLWHGSSLHRWENAPFTLCSYQMVGLPVLGPANADSYLTENYGDWRTPITEFNCSTDTPNLVLVKHPSTVAVFLRMVVEQYKAENPNWAALCAELIQNRFIVKDATSPGRYLLHPELFQRT